MWRQMGNATGCLPLEPAVPPNCQQNNSQFFPDITQLFSEIIAVIEQIDRFRPEKLATPTFHHRETTGTPRYVPPTFPTITNKKPPRPQHMFEVPGGLTFLREYWHSSQRSSKVSPHELGFSFSFRKRDSLTYHSFFEDPCPWDLVQS